MFGNMQILIVCVVLSELIRTVDLNKNTYLDFTIICSIFMKGCFCVTLNPMKLNSISLNGGRSVYIQKPKAPTKCILHSIGVELSDCGLFFFYYQVGCWHVNELPFLIDEDGRALGLYLRHF